VDPALEPALDTLVEGFIYATRERHGRYPRQVHDPAWPSPCEKGAPDADGRVEWRPVRRNGPADFAGLAAALETDLHPDFGAYFGRYWSDPLPAAGLYGRVELLQLWNAEDQERLVANQIGHVLQARRARRPLTLFFACTDDPDLLYSLDNASGEVLREALRERSARVIAGSLAEFLAGLRAEPGA
jgi:SecY interacting protein Syd